MKKVFILLSLVIIIISAFSVGSNAADNYTEDMWSATDEQTKEYLNDLGIDEVSFDELFDLTPTRVIKFVFELCFQKAENILNILVKVIVVMFLISIAASFLKNSGNTENIIFLFGALVIMSIIVVPISRMMTDVIAGIRSSTIFINSYLPIMTAIIVASKNPALALTYNSFSLFLSSVITNVADKFIVPCVSMMLSFNILSSFSFENYRDKITSGFRRVIVVILALFSTVFSGLLTTQSLLATSSDNVVLRGIKFISGAFVPVVGAGVGDALSSVISSFAIMRNTLGVFVIVVIILINLPIMAELLVWYFALQLCSIVSSMLGIKQMSDLIDSISSIISLLNIIVFFITFVLIISTGIVIMIGK